MLFTVPWLNLEKSDGDRNPLCSFHYDDVIMTMLASQITSLPVVCSIVYSDVNQRKHQSSASLAFVREIHRGPVNFPHKWPVTRKMFPFDDVIMFNVAHDLWYLKIQLHIAFNLFMLENTILVLNSTENIKNNIFLCNLICHCYLLRWWYLQSRSLKDFYHVRVCVILWNIGQS